MIEIDRLSRIASVSGQVRFRELEAALGDAGLTLGMLRESDAHVGQRLLMGCAMDRSPRYGRLADACLGIELANEDGTSYELRPVPRRAAGPDWRALYSSLPRARVARAVLRVHGRPESRIDFSFLFPSRAAALEAAYQAVRMDVAPATWSLIGATLAGRLEGVHVLTSFEQVILVDLGRAHGAQSASALLRSYTSASFVPWSRLRESECDVAEMCLDGGLLLGEVPIAGRGLELGKE